MRASQSAKRIVGMGMVEGFVKEIDEGLVMVVVTAVVVVAAVAAVVGAAGKEDAVEWPTQKEGYLWAKSCSVG